MKGQKVTSLKEIGILKATNNGGLDVSDVEALMKGLDDDVIERANAEFVENITHQMEAIAKGEDVYRVASEKLQKVEARIEKMVDNNTYRDIFDDTPQIIKLRGVAAQLKEMMKKASDEEKKNPFAAKLLKFQKVFATIKELVKKSNETFNNLNVGENVDKKVIEELKNGFAQNLYRFVEEDGWMEPVPEKQLREWAEKHQSFNRAAVSWTVKNCPDHRHEYCDHWYWGANEQGVALCKNLGLLDDANTRIREILKKKKQSLPRQSILASEPTVSKSE